MNATFVRIVFVALIGLGIVTASWGSFIPFPISSEFGRVVIRDLGLPKDEGKVASVAANFRRALMKSNSFLTTFGVGIVLVASIGLVAAWNLKDSEEAETEFPKNQIPD